MLCETWPFSFSREHTCLPVPKRSYGLCTIFLCPAATVDWTRATSLGHALGESAGSCCNAISFKWAGTLQKNSGIDNDEKKSTNLKFLWGSIRLQVAALTPDVGLCLLSTACWSLKCCLFLVLTIMPAEIRMGDC